MKSIRDCYRLFHGHHLRAGKATYDSITERVELSGSKERDDYFNDRRDLFIENTILYAQDGNNNAVAVGTADHDASDGHIRVVYRHPLYTIPLLYVVEPNTPVSWWPCEGDPDAMIVYPVDGPGTWLPPYLPRYVEDFCIVYSDNEAAAILKQMLALYPNQNEFQIGRWDSRAGLMRWAMTDGEDLVFAPITHVPEVTP